MVCTVLGQRVPVRSTSVIGSVTYAYELNEPSAPETRDKPPDRAPAQAYRTSELPVSAAIRVGALFGRREHQIDDARASDDGEDRKARCRSR